MLLDRKLARLKSAGARTQEQDNVGRREISGVQAGARCTASRSFREG